MNENPCTCPNGKHLPCCPFAHPMPPGFLDWWRGFYGHPAVVASDDESLDEYNTRLLFALHGFNRCADLVRQTVLRAATLPTPSREVSDAESQRLLDRHGHLLDEEEG